MTVDKFGGRGTDDRSGVSFNFMKKSFVRRDGSNTVTGLIDMTGNTLNNVTFPTSERDVATKATSIQTALQTKFPNLVIL